MNKFLEAIHDMIEIITGERPKTERNSDRRSVDRGTSDRRSKPKRARTKKGTYKGDDLSTAFTNEAWVGGKAPNRVKTVGYKKRKK